MKVFIAVLVLIFSLQSWTKADDIYDFEIEGMSIGDSLLDYFSEAQISNSKKFYYPKSNKFVGILSNIFNKNPSKEMIELRDWFIKLLKSIPV